MFQFAEFADIPLRVVAADVVYDLEYTNVPWAFSHL